MPTPPQPAAARSVATSVAARITVLALNMATGILTARLLHPAGNGALAAMKLFPLFLTLCLMLGTASSLIYHLKSSPKKGDLIGTALLMSLALSTFAALTGAIALPHWLHQYPPHIILYARVFLLAAPFWALQITGQAALEAMELFSLSNLAQLLIPLTTLAALLTCLALHHFTPVAAAACYTVAIVPTALTILTLLWRRRTTLHFSASIQAAKTLIHYGLRSAPLDLLGTLNLYVDSVLVIGLLSASAMGSYAVVLSLSRALLVFQSAVVMVLFPKAAGRTLPQILDMVGRSVRVSTLVTGTAALAVVAIGPILLKLLYGEAYLTAVPALRLLVLEVVLQGAVLILAQAFMAAGRPGVVSLLQAAGLSLSIPLMFLFIPRFGVAGAALALLCSTATRLALIYAAMRLVLKSPAPNLIPTRSDLTNLTALLTRRHPKA